MAAIPTLETVITAIKAVMDAISSLGTVLTGYETLEDQVEVVERGNYISSGSMNLWFLELDAIDELEGDSPGEVYEQYNIIIRYWSLRTNNADWSKEARTKAESVRDALSGLASVFSVGSQRQLRTPETVGIASHGPASIRGTEGEQMIYQTVLRLSVEARRWI